MKHYLIAHTHVRDRAWVPDYLANVTRLVHQHGGEFLARSSNVERLEGGRDGAGIVSIIAFPSREAAEAFYTSDAYAPYRAARQAGSEASLFLVAGEDLARRVTTAGGHPLARRLVHPATMLAVSDLEQSVAFYHTHFGFEVHGEQEGIVLLSLEPMLLYLVTESPPTSDKPGVTIAPPSDSDRTPVNLVFRVDDCQAAYEELREHGVTFLAPPESPPWGGWRAFARDPDGYLIEIEEAR